MEHKKILKIILQNFLLMLILKYKMNIMLIMILNMNYNTNNITNMIIKLILIKNKVSILINLYKYNINNS
jgi:hypothetical protein